MRLPLLLAANPLISKPEVLSVILPGRWRIVSEDLVDSILEVESPKMKLSVGEEFNLDVHTAFFTKFIHRGTESRISLFAERI